MTATYKPFTPTDVINFLRNRAAQNVFPDVRLSTDCRRVSFESNHEETWNFAGKLHELKAALLEEGYKPASTYHFIFQLPSTAYFPYSSDTTDPIGYDVEWRQNAASLKVSEIYDMILLETKAQFRIDVICNVGDVLEAAENAQTVTVEGNHVFIDSMSEELELKWWNSQCDTPLFLKELQKALTEKGFAKADFHVPRRSNAAFVLQMVFIKVD